MQKQEQPYTPAYDDYIPHQVCPRCSLNLSQDVCVCGWRRPVPPKKKKQSDLLLKGFAAVAVCGVLWWLVAYFLPTNQ
ncbi:MAG: hypothetical protein K2X03_15450 [Bryobacteraceae bacterium]|nr:hypothetical protein [Bryobacteraceae bacterium]